MKNKLIISKFLVVFVLLQSLFMLSACSGNSFHLRKNIDLPKAVQQVQLTGLNNEHGLYKVFDIALEESGGQLLKKASTIINISGLREDKRVVSYTRTRKVREYLVFLKLDYSVQINSQKASEKLRIRLDRSFIYDANFALGKVEEEDKIREDLQKEAARIIMLRLQYMGN